MTTTPEGEDARRILANTPATLLAITGALEDRHTTIIEGEVSLVILLARIADARGMPRAEAWELYRRMFMNAPPGVEGIGR